LSGNHARIRHGFVLLTLFSSFLNGTPFLLGLNVT
jgi:hypothetical protein